MLFERLRGRRREQEGVFASVLDNLLALIEVEVLLTGLDLQEMFKKNLERVLSAGVFLAIAAVSFVFLNVAALLWLRSLFMDTWVPFLAMGLVYAALALSWLLRPARTLTKPQESESPPRETLEAILAERKARLSRATSPRSLLGALAFPLVLGAWFFGFVAAPQRRGSAPPGKSSAPRGTGFFGRVLENLVARMMDRLLDLYFSPGTRKRAGDDKKRDEPT
jgi:hypothetical protein